MTSTLHPRPRYCCQCGYPVASFKAELHAIIWCENFLCEMYSVPRYYPAPSKQQKKRKAATA